MSTSEGDSKWLRNIVEDLVGFTITQISDTDEDGFFDIHVNKGDETYKLTPSCDPEGNGPGFLFIEGAKP